MDSAAIAFWLKPTWAFTIDYGQAPADGEIRAAAAIADHLGIRHDVIRCDISTLGSGDMAGSPALELAPVPEWWPFRNQYLITIAAMRAVALGCDRLIIGCLRTDGQHADGTAAFVAQMRTLLSLQEGAMVLDAPAVELTACELVQQSGIPLEVLAWAHSCHVSDYACGTCRGCRKHYETLVELGAAPY
jgi:7-cyano-7-deazaguanine synthase